jgi:hypothetical protein
MEVSNPIAVQKTPWNKGKLVGQKQPLRLKEIAGKGIANVGAARAALLLAAWMANRVRALQE